MLREDNARKGFFEEGQYLGVRAHLPKHLQPVATFAYITGWRIRSEILPLTWQRVDFKAGVIRLDVNTTKSGEGREFVMTVRDSPAKAFDAGQDIVGGLCPDNGLGVRWR
jgi:integrase